MSDSPRPANAMSAPSRVFALPAAPNATARMRHCALALAATLLPCSLGAAIRHASVSTHRDATHTVISHAATAHARSTAAAKHTTSSLRVQRAGTKFSSRRSLTASSAHKAAPARDTPREALAAKAAVFHKGSASLAPSKPEPRNSNDIAADNAVQDRVHAWMRAHGSTPAQSATEETLATQSHTNAQRITGKAAKSKAPLPDLSQQQTAILHTNAPQTQSRTTADDAAATLAESQIPRTAPTARVPAPFTHGDLLGNPAATVTQQPATIPTLQPSRLAPIVRNTPAVSTITAAAKHPMLDPQVTAAMSDETFSDDGLAPTPATAIALSAKKTPAAKAAAISLDDIDPDTLSTGAIAKVNLYDTRGRLRLIPAMKGSHDILVHQNQMAMSDGLSRVEDDDQLNDMRKLKLLVPLPNNSMIAVNDPLPTNRRYARPWSVRFLNDLARAHYARFHTPLIITSAVRTVAFQRRLVLTNGNAAPPTGDIASPHLYGQAIDLGKRGMSITEIAWMRAYLTPIEDVGKIDVEEEFQQACFHISVYRRYLGLPARKPAPHPEAASTHTLLQAKATPATKHHHLPTALLATGLR